jgi:CDP-diacylglycerol--glycerol-3-phosphate 3-phosphatidyltransferase
MFGIPLLASGLARRIIRKGSAAFHDPVVDMIIATYDGSMSLANVITLTRGLLIAPIVILLATGHRWAAWWLFGIACFTDLIDGFVARARNEVTQLGKVLDPILDKSLYVSVLSMLAVLGDVPSLALGLFLFPQVAIGLGALLLKVRKNAVQQARLPGKAASALAFIAIAFLIVRWPGGIEIFYAATAATYIAAGDYTISGIKRKRGSGTSDTAG